MTGSDRGTGGQARGQQAGPEPPGPFPHVYPPGDSYTVPGDRDRTSTFPLAIERPDIVDFLPWEKFDHPELGEVEIGGKNPKFFDQNGPAEVLEDFVRGEVDFNMYSSTRCHGSRSSGPTPSASSCRRAPDRSSATSRRSTWAAARRRPCRCG